MFIFFEAKISKHLLQNEINIYRKKQYLYKGGNQQRRNAVQNDATANAMP